MDRNNPKFVGGEEEADAIMKMMEAELAKFPNEGDDVSDWIAGEEEPESEWVIATGELYNPPPLESK